MDSYDDDVRKGDGIRLRLRDIEKMTPAERALAIFVTHSQLRPMLEAVDPMAMRQARVALGLIEEG